MASHDAWRAAAITLMIVTAVSMGLWARTQWGNDNRTCWNGDQSYPCSAAETAAADMAASAMGDLILLYLGVLALFAGVAWWQARRLKRARKATVDEQQP